MLNSNIKSSEIENKIREVECQTPLEVRVVFASRPMKSAIGGMRCLLFVLFLFALLIDVLWIPFPAWILYFLALPIVFLPAHFLTKVPYGNKFIFRKELSFAVAERARQVFRELRMGSTLTGNALLILFCLHDRIFHILPDPRMETALAEEEWRKYTSLVEEKLSNHSAEPDHGITQAVLELLEDVKQKSVTILGKRDESHTDRPGEQGELENKVVEIDV